MTGNRSVLVLGSTGSIGVPALELIARHPERFTVAGLAAGGGDVALLARQVRAHGVRRVAVAAEDAARALRDLLPGIEVLAGPDAATELTATATVDMVLNGITGAVGLGPTLAALASGATLALANKESLVAGGALVTAAAAPGQIVPVDSEHSALAQCLRAGGDREVRRLVLTASGGPFRGRRRDELTEVTPEQALRHPTWNMGPVVTINSATMVNKALEVIEAHELFGTDYHDIAVMVHPQSVIHSMVEFVDGSTIAQASPPDMRLPIALALGWPDRVPSAARPVDWTTAHTWDFAPLDDDAFPAVRLAKAAGDAGHCRPAIYNAANEDFVAACVEGRLPFLGIVDSLEQVLADAPNFDEPGTVEDVRAAEAWARAHARTLVAPRTTNRGLPVVEGA
jgi:1-deoxy-D-xylulose-5-phosphate reductoisomerase